MSSVVIMHNDNNNKKTELSFYGNSFKGKNCSGELLAWSHSKYNCKYTYCHGFLEANVLSQKGWKTISCDDDDGRDYYLLHFMGTTDCYSGLD